MVGEEFSLLACATSQLHFRTEKDRAWKKLLAKTGDGIDGICVCVCAYSRVKGPT